MRPLERLARRLEVSPAAALLTAGLAVANVVLVNWSRPLFGRWWRYVMWEGGVIEDLTVVHFLAAAAVFAACALSRGRPRAERAWFAAFAAAGLLGLGEETNYGRGTLFLNLGAPNFQATYNPQGGNLHGLTEAFIPVLAFFVAAGVLRLGSRPLIRRLRLPIPRGFLNAVLLTAVGVLFMRFDDDRYLSVDEVYEWSTSLLLLALAAHARWGWFFRDQVPHRDGPGARRASCAARPMRDREA